VLVGNPAEPPGLNCVDLDYTAAGAACVHHLADLGHRAVALIGPHRRSITSAGRLLHGFTDAARSRGVRATARPCAHSYDAVRACLDALLATQPTGIVVHNEAVLPAVLAELHGRGRRVPEDVSVVGVCPDSMALTGPVPLTSVAVPTAELAEIAVTLTVRHAPPAIRLLAPRLTARASTR
jgi:DNA-binding LacI/PurR family transcriptional regulator